MDHLEAEAAVKVEQMCSICGIGDTVTARAVLEGSGWDLDAAVDFYFATGGAVAEALKEDADGGGGAGSRGVPHAVDLFCAITGCSDTSAAEAMLEANEWHLERAVNCFFPESADGTNGAGEEQGEVFQAQGANSSIESSVPLSNSSLSSDCLKRGSRVRVQGVQELTLQVLNGREVTVVGSAGASGLINVSLENGRILPLAPSHLCGVAVVSARRSGEGGGETEDSRGGRNGLSGPGWDDTSSDDELCEGFQAVVVGTAGEYV